MPTRKTTSMNLQIASSSFIPAEWVQGKTIFKRNPLDQVEAAFKLLTFADIWRLDQAHPHSHESGRMALADGFLFSTTSINGSIAAPLDDRRLSPIERICHILRNQVQLYNPSSASQFRGR